MKNTDRLYELAQEYQDKRKEILHAYDKGMTSIERLKGSPAYAEDAKKITNERDQEISKLKEVYKPKIDLYVSSMKRINSARGLTPPTEEELRLIQALKLKDNLTNTDLDLAAVTLEGNDLCISLLNELAAKAGHLRKYHAKSDTMPVKEAENAIDIIATEVSDFIEYDTSRIARIGAKHNQMLYGQEPTSLAKRKEFDSKLSFYSVIAGLDSAEVKSLAAAVDGE